MNALLVWLINWLFNSPHNDVNNTHDNLVELGKEHTHDPRLVTQHANDDTESDAEHDDAWKNILSLFCI